jgi:hypothetical protein
VVSGGLRIEQGLMRRREFIGAVMGRWRRGRSLFAQLLRAEIRQRLFTQNVLADQMIGKSNIQFS